MEQKGIFNMTGITTIKELIELADKYDADKDHMDQLEIDEIANLKAD